MDGRDLVEIIDAVNGQFGWHRKAPNGEIISNGETHSSPSDALRAAKRANPDLTLDSDYRR